MATKTKARKRGVLHRRRIIERPRLIALLDGSPSCVRTLIAPAGYGKTTLAEQWVGKGGRRHAWFTARPASVDVAALALGVARAATVIVPDCDARLREHLRAVPSSAENIEVLVEILGEDLAEWPEDAWLVLDDYHELVAAPEAERFVEELLAAAPIRALIASRQRPSWITTRKILYGEVLELNQTELAMDGHEAAEVLADRNAASASGLVALADGWPAVIGLASVSAAEIDDAGAVPDELYEFFAEEVFSALPHEVQVGLKTLAIAPFVDRALASELLGERCDRVCSAALDVGILVERGAQLEIHPLAQAFLETQLQHSGSPDHEAVRRCITYFGERKDWDAAFDVIVRRGSVSLLAKLMEDALDDLLETARLSTIEAWCDHASRAGFEAPVIRLARAEVALRSGRLAEAQAHAEVAAVDASPIQFRALITAGRAAHVASLDEDAIKLFRRAEAVAGDDAARRDARWGQALCSADLELPNALQLVAELASDVRTPREAVRAAGQQFVANALAGNLDLAAADRAVHLLPAVEDPLVQSGFLSVYSSGLAAMARYEDARRTALSLQAVAEKYRLDFALPYVSYARGIAEAGMHEWDGAERTLRSGIVEARKALNAHAEQGCVAALMRSLAQRGRSGEALELVAEYDPSGSMPVPASSRVELAATQAFILALAHQLDDACALVAAVRGLTRGGEPTVMIAGVDAIVAMRRHDAEGIDCVCAFGEKALSVGAFDVLVTMYRAVPELLAILLRSRAEPKLRALVRRVGDDSLINVVDRPDPDAGTSVRLTPREREVHQLLREGLSNRDIARVLVIAEGTAKRHVQNVYDKLGVRSRTAIAVKAALERAQATSAIEETGDGADS